MGTFVINEDQIKKIILAFVIAVIVSFLSGYFLGSKFSFHGGNADQLDRHNDTVENNKVIAEKVDDIKNKNNELKTEKMAVLAKKEALDKEVADKKKAVAKKIADKKAADKKKVAKEIADKKAKEKKLEIKKKEAARKQAAKKEEARKEAARKETARKEATRKEVARKKQMEEQLLFDGLNKVPTNDADTINPSLETEIENVSGEPYYSIQAGMFSSKTNAHSFIKKLSEKQFNAYLSEFSSSSGAIKYNVRVGKFEQRDQARDRLKELQKDFSSPAYVVITR